MSPAPLAAAWLVPGLVAAALATRTHRLRVAAVVPLVAAAVALLTQGGGADLAPELAPGGLALGQPAAGAALLGALVMTIAWLLAPPADAGEILAVAAAGALSAVALATGSPLVWGLALLGAATLVGMARVAAGPARATLAGLRVTALGATALVAAAPFLPVDASLPAPRVHLAGGLLATGVAALLALVPFGGWVTGAGRSVRPASLLPYVVFVLPAVVLPAQALQLALPPGSRAVLGAVMLPLGSLTAAFAAVTALLAADRDRYPRVLVADLGLVGLGLAAQQDGARLGSLLLLVTHMVVAPLLLAEPSAGAARPRRFAWLALSGVPPSPAGWGRLALVSALTGAYGGGPLVVMLPTLGALLAVSLRAIAAAHRAPAADAAAGRAAWTAAWLVPAAAIAFGLAPLATLQRLMGIG